MLHTNELPLRHLMEKMYGITSSKEGFTGPIGKMLAKGDDMERNLGFKNIPGLDPLVKIPDDVVENISTDSSD